MILTSQGGGWIGLIEYTLNREWPKLSCFVKIRLKSQNPGREHNVYWYNLDCEVQIAFFNLANLPNCSQN